MTGRDPKCIGYCGLACGMCINACVPDCRAGGGAKDCFQRACCQRKGIHGCWECEQFPCNDGHFASSDDPAWRGICIGSVHTIRELGVEEYLRRVAERFGNPVEYGNQRYLDPEDVRAKLCRD